MSHELFEDEALNPTTQSFGQRFARVPVFNGAQQGNFFPTTNEANMQQQMATMRAFSEVPWLAHSMGVSNSFPFGDIRSFGKMIML